MDVVGRRSLWLTRIRLLSDTPGHVRNFALRRCSGSSTGKGGQVLSLSKGFAAQGSRRGECEGLRGDLGSVFLTADERRFTQIVASGSSAWAPAVEAACGNSFPPPLSSLEAHPLRGLCQAAPDADEDGRKRWEVASWFASLFHVINLCDHDLPNPGFEVLDRGVPAALHFTNCFRGPALCCWRIMLQANQIRLNLLPLLLRQAGTLQLLGHDAAEGA